MSRHSRSAFGTVRRVADLAVDRQVTFLAAAIAYYAFVSLVPALLLLVVVATAVFGETIAAQLVAATGDFLTPAGEEAVVLAVSSAGGRTGASLLGVGVLLWSTLKVFRGLDTAFVSLYGGDQTPGFLKQVADAASVVVGVGLGLGAMVAVGAFVAAADALPLVEVASVLALPVLLAVVFLPMYYLLPQPAVGVREALPGAAFAAVGWTLLQAGFQVYAAGAAQYQAYGVIGGILLLVTWLYLAAVVVVLGGVVNVVLAERGGAGDGRPYEREVGPAGLPNDAADRQLQQDRDRPTGMNGESDPDGDDGERPRGAPDVAALEAEVRELRSQLDEFEDDVERRTVDKPEVESELKRYVRSRMRRGHARGWGPYLVLLYGTVLTLAALTSLQGIYAVGAIVVLGLSTLGLYTIFVVVGIGLNLIETPGKALDYARRRGDD
ncbi:MULTISPECIES: YihY/virulence factor BrkB family protein [Halorubrum]|uniref:Ribonuclease BN n=1 Tax=Halorubrum tropicale TaxID=1765655 RepID=A0A0N0BS67_9EURY|nr:MULTISPECIES: YihY/virulence factor BrkB family protein [Halorubrum]KOX97846.1 ribonuclease BN [Halorubrum tropicale]TKX43034.1 YihY/virulence factor BrkB family protein [Halorubrum sp. ARQ200]TKX50534.1 YihY/virulence factor BrkB family protein [Halorubrum sp. ASP121]